MKNACSSSLVHDLLPRYRATFLRLRPKTLQDGNAKWSSSARALSTNFSTSPSLESDMPASLPELSLRDFMKKKGPSAHVESFNDIVKTELSLKFHIETYGCQMNLSDTEIVRSILLAAGHTETVAVDDAELIFQNTCAIRENAETKIWNRLRYFRTMRQRNERKGYPKIGVLGCMAERLKEKLLEEEAVDLVCGPDAYRDLPRLVESVLSSDQKEANTQLSFEETYADINPIRKTGAESAFVSIMRGCNNMCSFCVVPFTRGRERSRDMTSIVAEINKLYSEDGVREVVLLGQNVNGFHDTSSQSALLYPTNTQYSTSSAGFTNLFQSRSRDRPGARFSDLLLAIAAISPDLRVRFTSPHPKDFPFDVLSAVANQPNICASLHLPVQSGSNSVLTRMRRGYTREAYLELVHTARSMIPNLKISTDIITGFCGETEEEHRDTLQLLEEVKYDQAFMFAYSLRDKTHAARVMIDDVSVEVKGRRLQEIIEVFRRNIIAKNNECETGSLHLVLVEGLSAKATTDSPTLTGRTDGNQRVIFETAQCNDSTGQSVSVIKPFNCESRVWDDRHLSREEVLSLLLLHDNSAPTSHQYSSTDFKGTYVVVKVLEATNTKLRGIALGGCSAQDWYNRGQVHDIST